jgi:TP901 family phage tail tape measure protein
MADKAGTLLIEVAANVARLEKDVRTMNQKLTRFGTDAKRAISPLEKGFKSATQAMKFFGVTLAATMVGNEFRKAISNTLEFSKGLKSVESLLDKDMRRSMGQFRKDILNISADFGEGTQTLTKGLYDIISASVPAAKATQVLTVAVKAAKAGMTDTGTAADALTTVLNSYGLQAEEAMNVADAFFTTIKKGKTTFQELAPAIGRVTPIAAALGMEFEEVGAVLATLTRGGLKTDEAVTALRSALMAFLKPQETAKNLAKDFGVELSAAQIRAKGFIGTMAQLSEASSEQRAKMMGNAKAIVAVESTIKNLEGAQGDLAAQMQNTGIATDAWRVATDTAQDAFDQLIQTFNTLKIESLAAFEDELSAIAKTLKDFIDWFRENKEEVKEAFALGPTAVGGKAGEYVKGMPRRNLIEGLSKQNLSGLGGRTIVIDMTGAGGGGLNDQTQNFISSLVAEIRTGYTGAPSALSLMQGRVGGFEPSGAGGRYGFDLEPLTFTEEWGALAGEWQSTLDDMEEDYKSYVKELNDLEADRLVYSEQKNDAHVLAWQANNEKMQRAAQRGAAMIGGEFANFAMSSMQDFENIGDAFSSMIQRMLQDIARLAMQESVIKPFINMIGGINWGGGGSGFVGPPEPGGGGFFSKIGDFFGNLFHSGGLAPGEVPAILEAGEYVIPRNAVNKMPMSYWDGLRSMHKGGSVKKFQTGGVIPPSLLPLPSGDEPVPGWPTSDFLSQGTFKMYEEMGYSPWSYLDKPPTEPERRARVDMPRIPKATAQLMQAMGLNVNPLIGMPLSWYGQYGGKAEPLFASSLMSGIKGRTLAKVPGIAEFLSKGWSRESQFPKELGGKDKYIGDLLPMQQRGIDLIRSQQEGGGGFKAMSELLVTGRGLSDLITSLYWNLGQKGTMLPTRKDIGEKEWLEASNWARIYSKIQPSEPSTVEPYERTQDYIDQLVSRMYSDMVLSQAMRTTQFGAWGQKLGQQTRPDWVGEPGSGGIGDPLNWMRRALRPGVAAKVPNWLPGTPFGEPAKPPKGPDVPGLPGIFSDIDPTWDSPILHGGWGTNRYMFVDGTEQKNPFWWDQFDPQYIARTQKPPRRLNERLRKFMAQFHPDKFEHYLSWYPEYALPSGTMGLYGAQLAHRGGFIGEHGEKIAPKRFHEGGPVGGGGSGGLPMPKITININNQTGVAFGAREEFSQYTFQEMIKSITLEAMATDPNFR